MRTGFGFDSHAFGKKGTLKLGGVSFAGVTALSGHSDGDALLYALIDALLGAACLGDIGDMFPDTSAELKDIDSGVLTSRAVRRVRASGWTPVHVDITVVADKPKLSPKKKLIRSRIAALLGVSASAVNVKAKTQEGLGWFGRVGGIAAWAVATVERA